jgi:hypothetical protein
MNYCTKCGKKLSAITGTCIPCKYSRMWLLISAIFAFTFGLTLYVGITDQLYTSSAWLNPLIPLIMTIYVFLGKTGLGYFPNILKKYFLIVYFNLLIGFSVVNISFDLIEDDSRFFAYTFILSQFLSNFIASIYLWSFFKNRSTKFTIN